MLFHSPSFLLVFLPAVLAGFFVIGALRQYGFAALWLALSSLVFYAWDDFRHLLPLILGSIGFNYVAGRMLVAAPRRSVLALSVAANLALLGAFKYLGLATETLSELGVPITVTKLALPIGISFYTFTQIAYLVDAYRAEASEYNPIHYLLFVTFFPHLIAGPILHHKEMMPQFARRETYRLDLSAIALGLSWFAAGLFKKVVLADGIAGFSDPVFAAADAGKFLSTDSAWAGAVAYTLQIYFDFSGYSDMAIGLALMFGITFPLNFFSPYKADSLIEFWRRWHITLSRFLRDYLYFSLGGNRKGSVRRSINLMITMLLGGLWHGASWNFVLWGGIHGAGLLVNHAWRSLGIRIPWPAARLATLLLVILAWVPFKAATFSSAWSVWRSMFGVSHGEHPINAVTAAWWISALMLIALCLPNTAQIFGRAPQQWRLPSWRLAPVWCAGVGVALGVAIAMSFSAPVSFLYFRF
ncbi:MBOAT family protein [Bradyrhizobium barranii subsp. barranii]|uniref:Probable alginate O-acetylase AlgI n=1 Tax=Bradyrhizobium barranii subsp. barranii TaxID=2823807 RepID=A0A939MBW4_9BRAD|nr:MBOAT family protein [Bradyrhizobium barranii]UEM08598.1 MBOAT family protein [Bradyrhizobium barranii subsp. barranii]